MSAFSDQDSLNALAREGYALNTAWIVFAPATDCNELDLASARADTQSAEAVDRARMNLLRRLRARELVAVGVTHFHFSTPFWQLVRPQICLSQNVQWDTGAIMDGRTRFAQVVVARLQSDQGAMNAGEARKAAGSTIIDHRKVGRPKGVDKIAEIVRELRDRADQPFAGLLKKERMAMVAATARERNSEIFISEKQPSRSTLITAFKLAESQRVQKV